MHWSKPPRRFQSTPRLWRTPGINGAVGTVTITTLATKPLNSYAKSDSMLEIC